MLNRNGIKVRRFAYLLLINILILVLIQTVYSNAQEKLDLFILAGQSNAQGWIGDADNYPEDRLGLDESSLLNWTFVDNESSGGKWVPMQTQSGRFQQGHFGPEVIFARELKMKGFNPAIFKYTKGATGLARDWKAPGEDGIYDHVLVELKSGIENLEEQGYRVDVRELIWIQGESDAGDEQTSKKCYQNLKRLIEHLRNDLLNKPDLKILLGVDEQHPFVENRPKVVEAQKKLAKEDPNITFTSMWVLPKADNTHLTPGGLVEHGKRLFHAFMNLSNAQTEMLAEIGNLKVINTISGTGLTGGKMKNDEKGLKNR